MKLLHPYGLKCTLSVLSEGFLVIYAAVCTLSPVSSHFSVVLIFNISEADSVLFLLLLLFMYIASVMFDITAGTVIYPILGVLGLSRNLLKRGLGSLTCLRMVLSEYMQRDSNSLSARPDR